MVLEMVDVGKRHWSTAERPSRRKHFLSHSAKHTMYDLSRDHPLSTANSETHFLSLENVSEVVYLLKDT